MIGQTHADVCPTIRNHEISPGLALFNSHHLSARFASCSALLQRFETFKLQGKGMHSSAIIKLVVGHPPSEKGCYLAQLHALN